MNNAKHTPGLWGIRERNRNTWVVSGDVEGEPFRGHLIASKTTCPDWDANALLIAAAPDLLDALTDLVGGNGKEGDLYSTAAMDKARAAIAKATGNP